MKTNITKEYKHQLGSLINTNIKRFSNYNSQFKSKMFVHNLTEKISISIQQLGKLLDILHRFPQQQRKLYLDKIQALKNQMVILKNNLKQANALNIQRKYNSLVISLSSLKTKIEDENNLILNKENRCLNASRVPRQAKNTHEDALRVIAEKEEQIGQLRLAVFEKEELIKINYQELRDYKRDCNSLAEQNRSMKIEILDLENELSAINQQFSNLQVQAGYLKVEKEDLEKQIKADNQALNRFSSQLTIAHERLLHFEKLAQISMMKTSVVEENIKRIQQQASNLNKNYKVRQEQTFKKEKVIEELKKTIQKKDVLIEELQCENHKNIQECEGLEKELSKTQRNIYELRSINKELKDNYDQDMKQWSRKFNELQMKEKEKSIEAEDYETKFVNIYNKNRELEEQIQLIKQENKQLKKIVEQVQERLSQCQAKQQALEFQNNEFVMEQKILKDKISVLQSDLAQKQKDIVQLMDSLQMKQIEYTKMRDLVQSYETVVKESQSYKIKMQNKQRSLVSELASMKNKAFHLEERNKLCEKTAIDLKKRLLKSKLEVIHDIRNTISP